MKEIILFTLLLTPLSALGQNIGIGTQNPFSNLHIVNQNAYAELARFESNGGEGRILTGNGSAFTEIGSNASYGFCGTPTFQDFAIRSGSIPRLYIKSSNGDTGIGTNNPEERLHVNGNACISGYLGAGINHPVFPLDVRTGNSNHIAGFANTTLDNALITVNNGSGIVDFGLNSAGGFVGTVTAGDFRIRTNFTVRMLLRNTDGFVGIGTESPSQRLDVSGNIHLSGNIIVEAPTLATLLNGWFVYDNAFGTPQFSKDKQGRVLMSGLAEHTPITGGHIFTLPAGYRPEKSMYFMAASDHPNGFNKILINHTNGEVSVVSTGSNITWVSFDNIIFRGN